jgi:hypothetical protein
MRQGCALGLGALKTALGVDALVKLLLAEPTEIWSEVARALGDVGAQAVMPLAAKLRDVDAERRDRIIHALAHVAARTGGAHGPLEGLAAGRDRLVAAAAERALASVAEVQAEYETVRGRAGRAGRLAEPTVVRGFSRRFYEVLDGAARADATSEDSGEDPMSADASADAEELTPADLEQIDTAEHGAPADEAEPLDEEDLVTATDVQSLPRLLGEPKSTPATREDSTDPRPRGLPRDR